MKFFATAAAAAALFASVASAYNGFYKPEDGEQIPAGSDYLIKWVNDIEGQVAINLKQGPSTNLKDLGPVVMLEYNWGNYTWHVPSDLPAGKDYAFQITWGKNPSPTDINYTGLFEITNGDSKPSDDYSSTTTTEESSATETSAETSTETSTSAPVATETPSYTNGTVTTTTGGSTPSGTSHSNTSVTVTKSTATSSSTAPAKDDDSAANVFGASAGVAAAVALAAAVLL